MQREDHEKHVIARGKFLQLVRRGGWEYAERVGVTGVVGIVAVTAEGDILLTEQYRVPVGGRVIELPAGLAGDGARGDEELAEAARRELLEETGYAAERLEFLTAGPSSSGLTSEVVTLFRAIGLRKVDGGGGDASEDIQVHAVPLREAPEWLARRAAEGLLVEPRVYAGLFFIAGAEES